MRRILPAVVAMLWLSGCGYVGDPLPPLANVPAPVTGLAVLQRGSQILVQFALPTVTTEGVAIKTALHTELRIGTSPSEMKEAPTAGSIKDGIAHYEIPVTDWIGKQVTLAARVAGENRKESMWVNLENVEIVAPPERPTSLIVENAPGGVRLTWNGPDGSFRVFRKDGDAKDFTPIATVDGREWTDTAAALGKPYAYSVERVQKLSQAREATSDRSPTAVITPRDTFAPAAPAGLRGSAAPGSIELSWERNTEPDLAGYHVYRAAPNADFEKIADVSTIPAYSDRSAEAGKQYRYVVTALDQAGNESPHSAVVEAALR